MDELTTVGTGMGPIANRPSHTGKLRATGITAAATQVFHRRTRMANRPSTAPRPAASVAARIADT
jgi:hypothetical protein